MFKSLFMISILFLAAPLQIWGLGKAISHLSEEGIEKVTASHDHEHSHSHQHEDVDQHKSDHKHGENLTFEHSHSDGGPAHSHELEIKGVLLQGTLSSHTLSIGIHSHSISDRDSFPTVSIVSRQSFFQVLRPPIFV